MSSDSYWRNSPETQVAMTREEVAYWKKEMWKGDLIPALPTWNPVFFRKWTSRSGPGHKDIWLLASLFRDGFGSGPHVFGKMMMAQFGKRWSSSQTGWFDVKIKLREWSTFPPVNKIQTFYHPNFIKTNLAK